jgi:hypothetical protein
MTASRKKPFIVTNMSAEAESVVHFYNGRGIAEQWIKEGILDPKLLIDCFNMQNRKLRLNYKATESGLFSATRLIWGILYYIIVFISYLTRPPGKLC